MIEKWLPGAQHLQNLHPMAVHFPISFLTGAAFFYFLAWGLKKEDLAKTALWLLVAGTLTAALAAGLGLYAEPGVMVSFSVRDRLLNPHKFLMLSTLGLSVGLMIWAMLRRPFPRKGRLLFLFLFLILLGVMVKGADYGGRMVFDYNAGGNACSQPIEFSQ